MATNLLTMWKIKAYIGTAVTGDTWTYARLGEGLSNAAEALNEVAQQYFYLNGDGFAKNHITGMAPVWSFSGKRVQGDTAQDYIVSKKYGLDTERDTSFKLELTDNSGASAVVKTLIVPATLANIVDLSGESTDDSEFSFDLMFDGKPTVTTA